MTKRRVILLILVLIVAAAVWVLNSEWLKIDGCLDGGGRWDHVTKSCQLAPGAKI
ncbi:hypothetical protein [Sphingomonas sp.]|uniref:hypothetical protein n=1 Tax=Sphingomonas sp. TaxID=28214 RepID=UPI002ED817FA